MTPNHHTYEEATTTGKSLNNRRLDMIFNRFLAIFRVLAEDASAPRNALKNFGNLLLISEKPLQARETMSTQLIPRWWSGLAGASFIFGEYNYE